MPVKGGGGWGSGGKGGQAQGSPKQLFPRRLQVFSKSPKSMGKSNSFFYFSSAIQSGAPNDGFLLNTMKTLFRLPRVLLDRYKCILIGTVKFGTVRSS